MKMKFLAPVLAFAMVAGCSDEPEIPENSEIKNTQVVNIEEPAVQATAETNISMTAENYPLPESSKVEAIEQLTEDSCAEKSLGDVKILTECEAPKYFSDDYEDQCLFGVMWYDRGLKEQGQDDPDVIDASWYFNNRVMARLGVQGPSTIVSQQGRLYPGGRNPDFVGECIAAAKSVPHVHKFVR